MVTASVRNCANSLLSAGQSAIRAGQLFDGGVSCGILGGGLRHCLQYQVEGRSFMPYFGGACVGTGGDFFEQVYRLLRLAALIQNRACTDIRAGCRLCPPRLSNNFEKPRWRPGRSRNRLEKDCTRVSRPVRRFFPARYQAVSSCMHCCSLLACVRKSIDLAGAVSAKARPVTYKTSGVWNFLTDANLSNIWV